MTSAEIQQYKSRILAECELQILSGVKDFFVMDTDEREKIISDVLSSLRAKYPAVRLAVPDTEYERDTVLYFKIF